eukprot:403333615
MLGDAVEQKQFAKNQSLVSQGTGVEAVQINNPQIQEQSTPQNEYYQSNAQNINPAAYTLIEYPTFLTKKFKNPQRNSMLFSPRKDYLGLEKKRSHNIFTTLQEDQGKLLNSKIVQSPSHKTRMNLQSGRFDTEYLKLQDHLEKIKVLKRKDNNSLLLQKLTQTKQDRVINKNKMPYYHNGVDVNQVLSHQQKQLDEREQKFEEQKKLNQDLEVEDYEIDIIGKSVFNRHNSRQKIIQARQNRTAQSQSRRTNYLTYKDGMRQPTNQNDRVILSNVVNSDIIMPNEQNSTKSLKNLLLADSDKHFHQKSQAIQQKPAYLIRTAPSNNRDTKIYYETQSLFYSSHRPKSTSNSQQSSPRNNIKEILFQDCLFANSIQTFNLPKTIRIFNNLLVKIKKFN